MDNEEFIRIESPFFLLADVLFEYSEEITDKIEDILLDFEDSYRWNTDHKIPVFVYEEYKHRLKYYIDMLIKK